MAQALFLTAPRTLHIGEMDDAPLGARQVRVRTLYSGISAGTEMTQYRGSNPYLHKRWDPDTRLFLPAAGPSQPYPLVGWGYEEVGEVVAAGSEVTLLAAGDIVYGTWGHRTHAVLDEEYAAARLKPPALDPLLAIFSHLGPIALNGILDADLHIGETVAIFGLGAVGQVVGQLARRSGARVVGVDLMDRRLELARASGAVDVALRADEGSATERIKEMTDSRGADVCIECTGFAAAVHEAVRAAAWCARVVALGFVQGGAGDLYLGEEFHHNRIQLVCSQIGAVNPALSRRWDRLRLIHTIMDLQVQGALDLRPLITHIIPFAEAPRAFDILDRTPAEALQIVLDFGK